MAVSLLDVNLLRALPLADPCSSATQIGFVRLSMQPAVVKILILFRDASERATLLFQPAPEFACSSRSNST